MAVLFLRHIRYVLCTLSISWTWILSLPAQSDPVLEEITVEDGLSQGYVNTIFQDKEGFLWFCTRNGLNRYDGREIKVFTNDPLYPYSISENNVINIQEEGEYLIIRTLNKLNVFHKKTQRFHQVRLSPALGQPFAGVQIRGSVLYRDGWLWCGVWDDRTKESKIFELALKKSFGGPDQSVEPQWSIEGIRPIAIQASRINLWHLRGNTLWGAADNKLIGIDANSGKVTYHTAIPGKIFENSKWVTADGTIWFGGESGIGKIDNTGIHWTQTDFPASLVCYLEKQRRLLVSRGLQLLFFAEPDTKKTQLLASEGRSVTILDRGKVIVANQDRSGNIWLGTNGFGVIKYTPVLQRFRTVFQDVTVHNSILTDAAGHYGFFTVKEWYSSSPGLLFHNAPDLLRNTSQSVVDGQGKHWLSSVTRNNKHLLIYRESPASTSWEQVLRIKLEYVPFYIISADNEDNIWVAVRSCLFRYNDARRQLDSFRFDLVLTGRYRVNSLRQTADGKWWIGTSNGLVQATPNGAGFVFKCYQVVPGEQNSIQSNEIATLLEDPEQPNILWIGTLGGGLSRLDTRTLQFTHFNVRKGLPDNNIYGILNDDKGLFWMSSNKGIIRFDPASGESRNYTTEDGLPTNEFNMNAYAKLPDGTLLFGGIKGLVSFHPDNFQDNPVPPQILITGLEVNNRRVVFGDSSGILQQAIEFTSKLALPYGQNSITLKFAALEFTIPSKNRFRYYLKGAEPEWAHTTTEFYASYLNLPPGKYTFMVKAGNSDGVWNETPAALQITILPPWYRTAWAYAGYILLFLGLCYGSFRFFLHRQHLQYKLSAEKREAERLKELDTFKSRVFTNITHEFRTPLTVIQGMADRMTEYENHQPVARVHRAGRLIRRNGAALLRLINQLLDLAKLEANVLTLHPEQTDLVRYVKYLAGSFESLAANKAVRLHTQINLQSIRMAVDQEKLQTILHNLLSNAIKFTPANGNITFHLDCLKNWPDAIDPDHFIAVSPSGDHTGDWAVFKVVDSGAGIAPDKLPHIFDRFYQSSAKEGGGSGIGLALVKELVQLMEGVLAVRSNLNRGTEFIVMLPVRIEETANVPSLHAEEKFATEQFAPVGAEAPGPDYKTKDLPTLLIIEDNPDVRDYLIGCVEGTYKVITAADGQQGIDLALKEVPDIIVSDVMMPLQDGFEVVHTLKNDERSSHIPIVLLTAKADLDSRIMGLERGADAYLAKPFDRQELLVHLWKLLELRRKLQERYAARGNPAEAGGAQGADKQPHYEDIFMNKVRSTLEANLGDEHFGIPELCHSLQMSRAQLHNKLKALTGRSASHYIRSVRLQRARELVLTTDRTVSEIAFEVGFRHLQHFSTSFAEEFGRSPSSLRKQDKNDPA
ncbi:MAG: helix-turn-helix domain-containing protein [Lewinellaceae bacterium]|nr:helix-turn-helix domain-containing protein [Lewinellaceae bacterium]